MRQNETVIRSPWGTHVPRPRLVIVLAILVLMSACAGNKRSDSLTQTLTAYHATMRWGDFQRALEFVDPDYREAHPLSAIAHARYRQVRVVGYDEGGGPAASADGEVRQVVKISLVNLHTQRERFVIDRQIWKWDPLAERWWLTTGLPDITGSPASD